MTPKRARTSKKVQAKKSAQSSTKINYNFFLAIILLVAIIVSARFLFRIKKIECIVDDQPAPEFCNSLSFLKDRSLFFTRFDQTPLFTSTLTNEEGQVFEPQSLEKKLPNKLVVNFQKQDPVYILVFEDQSYVVNSQGFLAKDTGRFQLPQVNIIDVYEDQITQERVKNSMHQSLSQFIEYFNQQELIYNDFTLNKQESRVRIDGVDYIFEDSAQPALLAIEIKLVSENLAEIVAERAQGETVEQVDMRFNLPVVKFNQTGISDF